MGEYSIDVLLHVIKETGTNESIRTALLLEPEFYARGVDRQIAISTVNEVAVSGRSLPDGLGFIRSLQSLTSEFNTDFFDFLHKHYKDEVDLHIQLQEKSYLAATKIDKEEQFNEYYGHLEVTW